MLFAPHLTSLMQQSYYGLPAASALIFRAFAVAAALSIF